jgi:hypothetical protein
VFLTVAAGSILHVLIQLLGITQRGGQRGLLHWALLSGLAAVGHCPAVKFDYLLAAVGETRRDKLGT